MKMTASVINTHDRSISEWQLQVVTSEWQLQVVTVFVINTHDRNALNVLYCQYSNGVTI